MGDGVPTMLLGFPLLLLTLGTTALWLTGGEIYPGVWQSLAVGWAVVVPIVAVDISMV